MGCPALHFLRLRQLVQILVVAGQHMFHKIVHLGAVHPGQRLLLLLQRGGKLPVAGALLLRGRGVVTLSLA